MLGKFAEQIRYLSIYSKLKVNQSTSNDEQGYFKKYFRTKNIREVKHTSIQHTIRLPTSHARFHHK